MRWRSMGKRMLAMVFPNRCAYCGEVVPYPDRICDTCVAILPHISGPACRLCGQAAEDCRCGQASHPYDACVSALYYSGPTQSAILRLKSKDYPYIAEELALTMIRAYRQGGEPLPDAITYIPMTRKEERRRGFNQTRMLAEQVGIGLDRPVVTALQKVQETKPQKAIKGWARSGNVLGAFGRHPDAEIAGKHWLLIDDLVTTGSTAGECAKVLKIYDATAVTLLTAANTIDE